MAMKPLPRSTTHTWRVPGSKSITNRALILGALCDSCVIADALDSDDTAAMRSCLTELGVAIEQRAAVSGGLDFTVRGGRPRLRQPARELYVGNSGTTARFCAAMATLVPGKVTLNGDAAMGTRPIADLVDGLRQLGVTVDCATGCPPLTVHGRAIAGGRVTMRGDHSSQYFTALLLVASQFDGDLEVAIAGDLVSRPYVDMTVAMIRQFAGQVTATKNGFTVRGRQAMKLPSGTFHVEPDASSASYAFATAAATGSTITVPGLDQDSLQGDFGFVRVLEQMGAKIAVSNRQTTVIGPKNLRGVDVDMKHISDTVMTLAAIAPLCDGQTKIRNIANIRLKETDRLHALVQELRRLGQKVDHGDDWIAITPAPIKPAAVECYNDHRMAMSFAILGLARDGVTITDPACTAKTYPGFWRDLSALYVAAGGKAPWTT
jgi:3-phosphoshikimate 1-carboxyvinyltransferase